MGLPAILVLAMAGLVSLPAPQPVGALSPLERQVLMELFTATGGPRWTRHDGWGTSSPVCDWDGVVCDFVDGDANRPFVAGLSLAHNNLEGRLPASLATLPRLRTLDVTGNRLTGPLPEALLQRWDEHTFELSSDGNDFSNLVARVWVTFAGGGTLCVEGDDLPYRFDVDGTKDRAVFQTVRCDPQVARGTYCRVREGAAGSLARFSRALQALRFTSMRPEYDYPFSGATHGLTLTTTAAWGDGSKASVETYNRQGPRDVWTAQQLFLSLLPASWERESRRPTCDVER